jgi:alkylation response protein AidB-like acyl-CoA dehydrogenase
MGFGPVDAMVVMEELGRGLVSAPYAQGALLAPTMLARGDERVAAAWLPKIADGSALVVLAHQERAARYDLARCEAKAQSDGSAWRVTGHKSVVPAGDEADAFLVPAILDGKLALFLVARDAQGVAVRGYPTQDGARASDVTLTNSPAALVTREGLEALELAQDIGIAALAAEAVGVMDRLVATTVDYLNTRKQFGVALSTFQALRHRVADVKMQLELGRSMSFYATLKLGEPAAQRRRALSQAKVQLNQSVRFVGQQCIQLHGGIGVTDEYSASHDFKRLTMIEMAWGDTPHHIGQVSERMQDTAGVFA